MKKFFVSLVLGAVATVSFAAVQYSYDFGKIGYVDNDNNSSKVTAWADRLHHTEGGTQNTLYFLNSANLFVSFATAAPSSWGGYIVNGDQKGADLTFKLLDNGVYTAVDASGTAVAFQAGDSVGFWVTDSNGNKVYNTPRLEGEHYGTFNGTRMLENNTVYANGFGQYGVYVHSTSYDEMASKSEAIMNIQVGHLTMTGSPDPAPAGQPLPGVLAALLLGGGAIGGGTLFKRRKAAKN